MYLIKDRIEKLEQSICDGQNELEELEEELTLLQTKQLGLLEMIDKKTQLKKMMIDHPELFSWINDLD